MSETEISPDAYMGRPIDSLVFWAARMVKRIETYARLGDVPKSILSHEEEMRVAYLTALRLRAPEVVEYAESNGIECTADQIKENPFLAVTAIAHHLGVLED